MSAKNNPENASGFNHHPIDPDAIGKPVVPNETFKWAVMAAERGDPAIGEAVLKTYQLDPTQKQLLTDKIRKAKEDYEQEL